MNKLILTTILAVFTSVCSLGAAADTSDKSDHSKKEKWEKEYGQGGSGDASTSEIMEDEEPKDLSPDEKYKYRDQEVMDKKPYKEPK